jgi:ABC-type lipoprotein release transport system permease subunit
VLGLLGLASVVHALVVAIRRRRRDLALLATFGFTRRQISATVVWQATTMALFGLLIGVPLGIAIGRVGWTALADNLGILPEPVIPLLALLALAVGAAVALNGAALVPARLAARLRPATVLRSE